MDKKESRFEFFIDGVPNEFEAFVTAMATEYDKHRLLKGDSWKNCSVRQLYDLWKQSTYNYTLEDLKVNPSQLVDVANFCWFLWYSLKDEHEYGNI